MRRSLSRIATLTQRNLKEITRDPLSIVFALGLPLFMEVAFFLLFHDLTAQFEMKYLAPGIVVFSQAFLTLFVGMLISVDRNTSFLTRLYVSEARPHEFIIAYAASIIPLIAVQSVTFFIIGGVFDGSLFCAEMALAILVSVVTSLPFIALGILFGSLCNEKSIGGVSSIVIMGQSVLSGMWFPLDGLSGGMLTFMNILPFRNATLSVQNVLIGCQDITANVLVPLAIVLAYAVAAFIAAVTVFRIKMKAG